MIKNTGLDRLQKDLADAQTALAGLDGELGAVKFDPLDPSSIEAAIAEAEQMVDERLGRYTNNPFISPLVEQMKESYRNGILEKASDSRLSEGKSDDAEQ